MLQEKVVFYFDKAKEMRKEEGQARALSIGEIIYEQIITLCCY